MTTLFCQQIRKTMLKKFLKSEIILRNCIKLVDKSFSCLYNKGDFNLRGEDERNSIHQMSKMRT